MNPKRGGPRPGFGGRQPGAGRPVKPVTDKPVSVLLSVETARLLDVLRGDEPRSAFIRRLLTAYID
jgi:hypothetical protein